MAVHSRCKDVCGSVRLEERKWFILPLAKINSMGHGHMQSESTIHTKNYNNKKTYARDVRQIRAARKTS